MAKPDSFLPLTNAEFHVLLALAGGDRHGYALMQEVSGMTEGRVKLGPGTLYTLLDRMLQQGLIEESPKRPEQNEDQRRRYYRLARLGRAVLQAEAHRLETMLRAARRRLSHNV